VPKWLGTAALEDQQIHQARSLSHALHVVLGLEEKKAKNSEAKRAGLDSNPSPATLCEALDKLLPH
jgi:hypothetical protein